jgi:hypothetical protein
MGLTVKTKWELSSETDSSILRKNHGCWVSHYISLALSYSRSPLNGFIVYGKQRTSEVLVLFYYFNTILFYVINPLKTKRICFIQGLSAYRAVNTLHFGYKNQSLNVL